MLALFMNKLNIVSFPTTKSMVYRVPNLKNYRTYIKNQSKEKSGYKIKELSNHFLSIIINLKELFKT